MALNVVFLQYSCGFQRHAIFNTMIVSRTIFDSVAERKGKKSDVLSGGFQW